MARTTELLRPIETQVRTLRVEVVAGADLGKARVGSAERVSVGTAADNDLVLTDPTVSRYHLELEHTGRGISVRDLGSSNGTRFGPVSIQQATVTPGARLTLGKTQLAIEDADPLVVPLLGADAVGGLVGRSVALRRLMADVERVAGSDASVLISGETGSGKEVVARAIHRQSRRAGGPFEIVDCGALTPTLIASELFGHEAGAFTGAEDLHVGAFERARGGILFLDEIGELPAGLQTALLGVLERRSLKRVGGEQSVAVDVRVISATHRELRSEVNASRFRPDLYYRLAVVVLRAPALREHIEDLPDLIRHFLDALGTREPVEAIFPESAMAMLRRHQWPGNVRELRNFVEASVAFGEAQPLGTATEGNVVDLGRLQYKDARAEALRRFEKEYLLALLAYHQGNVSAAARGSAIHRSYLNAMLKRSGLR